MLYAATHLKAVRDAEAEAEPGILAELPAWFCNHCSGPDGGTSTTIGNIANHLAVAYVHFSNPGVPHADEPWLSVGIIEVTRGKRSTISSTKHTGPNLSNLNRSGSQTTTSDTTTTVSTEVLTIQTNLLTMRPNLHVYAH